MRRTYQHTQLYRRGDDVREIEVDNKVVFLRDGAGVERVHAFQDYDELDAFVARSASDLVADGFLSLGQHGASGPYDVPSVRADLRAIALAHGLPADDVDAALAHEPRAPHPLLAMRDLARRIPGLREAMRDPGGDLWTMWFGGEDRLLDEPVPEPHDPLLGPPPGAVVVGAADLERWLVTGETLWRYHPEDCTPLGPIRAFVAGEVRRLRG